MGEKNRSENLIGLKDFICKAIAEIQEAIQE